MLHFTAAIQPLAAAVQRADRLSPHRGTPIAVTAFGGSGSGGSAVGGSAVGGSAVGGSAVGGSVEVATETVFGRVGALVHEAGTAIVGLHALATVLGGLTTSAGRSEAEIRADGSRLTVSTMTARFALPLLESTAPERPDVPILGVATGLREAAAVVAEATARDGLPLFTAVRIRSAGDRLTLVATDRFRAAFASVPWTPRGGEVDALVPAASVAAAVRYVGPEVAVRAGGGWFGLDWPDGGITLPQLALPFPDQQIAALLKAEPIATVEVDADQLRAAVDRVKPFALKGIQLCAFDGAIAVSGWGELGEAREEVKASVAYAARATALYQPGYLADAVRAYAGRTVTIQLQEGIRPTVFGGGDLTYLVVPLREPRSA